MNAEVFARVTHAVIDEAAVRAAASAPQNGAVVVFHGIIRNHDSDRGVMRLEYSAHPDAEQFLARLVAAEQDASGLKLAAAHRLGTLRVGDVALVAAAGAAHRKEAFWGIERLVERIKAEVPIWKRQYFVDGESSWVGL